MMAKTTRNISDFLTPERHPRGERGDSIVYPVISRRARGLSLGINLFPDRKVCSYDCPYCEVAPFSYPDARLTAGDIERALSLFFAKDWLLYEKDYSLKDISISGSGEPTLSPHLEEALRAAKTLLGEESVRNQGLAMVPIVLITNSTGFLKQEVADLLIDFSAEARLQIWAKLDGGTERLHRMLSRSTFALSDIIAGIAAFSRRIPLTIQTMIPFDSRTAEILFDCGAYASTLGEITAGGGRVEVIQLYTVARHPAEPWVEALSDDAMAGLARQLGASLALQGDAAQNIRIECYGEYSELDWRKTNR